jgi:hypothetical protein
MTSERAVILSVLFLGLGLGLIFGFCHDSTVGFNGSYPAAGASLQVVLHTDGLPAMAGLASTVLGVLFLFAALVLAVLKMLSPRQIGQQQSLPTA